MEHPRYRYPIQSIKNSQDGEYGTKNIKVRNMILKTISDVQKYMHERALIFPRIAQKITLSEGDSDLPLEVVNALNLPHGYLCMAKRFRLNGVAIGYFELSPGYPNKSLGESLLEENGDDSLVKMFGDDSLIAVAAYESDPICVASNASDCAGNVYFLDVMSDPIWKVFRIADSFEKFMIFAGNLYRISHLYDGDKLAGREEMKLCCSYLSCSHEQAQFWDRAVITTLL